MRANHAPSGILTITALGVTGLAATAILAGCGSSGTSSATSSGASQPSGTMTMSDGSVMSDSQMKAMKSPSPTGMDMSADNKKVGPSSVAKLICGDEIAGTVKSTFGLKARPTGSGTWVASTREYTCRYPLAHSVLTLSVKDLDGNAQGRPYFDRLEKKIPGAHPIKGLEDLGFPAFENNRGQVGFLKDGKTLLIDATDVSASDIPKASSRTVVAYGVGAAVIACWKE
jgi:hypothetical protein